MKKMDLDLRFIQEKDKMKIDPIEDVLHKVGMEISHYARGYFSHVITTTEYNESLKEATLYILVPEISYDYKIISIEYLDIENVMIRFFPLDTIQLQNRNNEREINISKLESEIVGILNSNVANDSLGYLIRSILMRRHNKT